MKEYPVPEKYIGVRVDRYLRKEYTRLSLGEIFKSLRTGKIKINGKKIKENYLLQRQDTIQNYLSFGEKETKNFLELSLATRKYLKKRILYDGEDIFVFYKEAGELMHKGTSHEYGLAEIFQAYFQNEDFHFVNRLDKDTSGLVLAGKNLKVVRFLSQKIKDRTIQKKYYIIVKGHVKEEKFSKVSYLKKGETKVVEKIKKEEHYKECKTFFRKIKQCGHFCLLEAELETGRTHQLRVQLAGMGYPIVGDQRYGNQKAVRLFLHSHFLKIDDDKVWDTGMPKEFIKFLKENTREERWKIEDF